MLAHMAVTFENALRILTLLPQSLFASWPWLVWGPEGARSFGWNIEWQQLVDLVTRRRPGLASFFALFQLRAAAVGRGRLCNLDSIEISPRGSHWAYWRSPKLGAKPICRACSINAAHDWDVGGCPFCCLRSSPRFHHRLPAARLAHRSCDASLNRSPPPSPTCRGYL